MRIFIWGQIDVDSLTWVPEARRVGNRGRMNQLGNNGGSVLEEEASSPHASAKGSWGALSGRRLSPRTHFGHRTVQKTAETSRGEKILSPRNFYLGRGDRLCRPWSTPLSLAVVNKLLEVNAGFCLSDDLERWNGMLWYVVRSGGEGRKSRSHWLYSSTAEITGNQLHPQRRHEMLVSQCRYGNTTTLATTAPADEVPPYRSSTLLLDKYSTLKWPWKVSRKWQTRTNTQPARCQRTRRISTWRSFNIPRSSQWRPSTELLRSFFVPPCIFGHGHLKVILLTSVHPL